MAEHRLALGRARHVAAVRERGRAHRRSEPQGAGTPARSGPSVAITGGITVSRLVANGRDFNADSLTQRWSTTTLARVPHHLIDLCDPDEDFTAYDYADAAWSAFTEHGGFFVGGTGLYLRATAWTASSASWSTSRRGSPVPELRRAPAALGSDLRAVALCALLRG